MAHGKILAIDDEKNIRHLIQSEFTLEGFEVVTAGSGEEGLERFYQQKFDIVFLDLKLPNMDGIETLRRLKQKSSAAEVIMITGHGEVESAVMSLKLGARDYVTKPFKLDELVTLAKHAIQDRRAAQCEPKTTAGSVCAGDGRGIRCPSPAMAEIYRAVDRIAPTDATVLIQGETGVGKDVLATQIHQGSPRKKAPFVVLDCGMLNENLAESELYGHRKGAFSGADEQKRGLVEQSDKGTLFLDEIGNIDLDLQKKFLRFLETGRFRRVGETSEIQVDARIILATNVDLCDAVQKGQLRKDLLYRMDVVSLTIPPLRQRPEDIPLLVAKVIEVYGAGDSKIRMSSDALEILARYNWPGNIRELKSVITKALIFADTDVILPDDLPRHLAAHRKAPTRQPKTLEEMEKNHIIAVLAETEGNQSQAADILGINRKTLYKKIHKFKIFS
ncbi:sigma-54-dependent transcriptional regulator [Desulfococcus sp.]|uniref:sigma-54-dependent transcriptional regulator n=1 Tax=Desulfococcus sp. TaxID=2025834 RepID=UPI003593EA10